MTGRILIADAVAASRAALRERLSNAYYDVVQAQTAAQVLRLATCAQPELILLDAGLPDMDTVTLCRRLAAAGETAEIPVIVLAAPDQAGRKLDALRAGARDFLANPPEETALLARIRALMRARDSAEELKLREATCRELGFAETPAALDCPGRVALVIPDRKAGGRPVSALPLIDGLRRYCSHRLRVRTMGETLTETLCGAADVYVLICDSESPREMLSGLVELRSRAATRHAGILLLLPAELRAEAAIGLDLGANDVLSHPLEADELAIRLDALMRRKRQTDQRRRSVRQGLELAAIDPLTRLYNRRYAEHHLNRIAHRAAASGQAFSLMILDIDRFKTINDRHGHRAGDMVLAEVARRLTDNMRAVDLIARYGGEEFLVAMPDTEAEQAAQAAERLRRRISEEPFVLPPLGGRPAPEKISVTLSIGLAVSRPAWPATMPSHVPAAAPVTAAPPARAGSDSPAARKATSTTAAPTLAGAPVASPARSDPPPFNDSTDEALRALIDCADSALYASKAQGRNLVTLGCTAA